MVKGYSEYRKDKYILAYIHGIRIVYLNTGILTIDNAGWFNKQMIRAINYALRETAYKIHSKDDEWYLYNSKTKSTAKFFGNLVRVIYTTGKKIGPNFEESEVAL